jgi:protein TonB
MEPISVPEADCSDPDPEIIVPVSTVSPRYPSSAVRQRISGFVTLEFTITAEGETADIVVVASVPPEIFDDAAIRALSQWRYCALGKARRSVRTRLSFHPW